MVLPTPADVVYMKEHIHDTQVPQIISVNVLCMLIALVAILLRIISRRMIPAPFKMDDWTIIAATACLPGLFSIFGIGYCVSTHYGGGRHVILVTNPKKLAEVYLIIECVYPLSLTAIKTSILCLYHRIFPQRWFNITLVAVGAFVTTLGIAAVIVSIFQCTPIKAQWDTSVPAHCIEYATFSLVVSILNVVTDLVILALPMYPVWNLQTSTRKKWMLTVIFMIGCCACIVSIVRLAYITTAGITYDLSWTLNKSGQITTVELVAGILAACVPTYRPLIKYWAEQYRKGSSHGPKPASSPHGMAMSGSRYPKDQLDSIELVDKAARVVGVGDRGSRWFEVGDDEENLVRG